MWLRRPRKIGMKLARQGLQPKNMYIKLLRLEPKNIKLDFGQRKWVLKQAIIRMLSWLWRCRLHGPRKSWSFVLWPCGCTSHWVPAVSTLVTVSLHWPSMEKQKPYTQQLMKDLMQLTFNGDDMNHGLEAITMGAHLRRIEKAWELH